MESTENYIKQIADVHHFAEEVARAMIDIKMPEFASENMSVADASKLIGLPVTAIRAGIVCRKRKLKRRNMANFRRKI